MKKYFLFDDEQISGRTYFLRLFVSVILLVFLVGIWLVTSTTYKRARSLGWDEGYSRSISFLIILNLSVGFWPNSLLSSSAVSIITIPLYILQLYLIFKNAKPIKSSATGKKLGRIIGKNLYTPIKWKNIFIYVVLGLLIKVGLHFSFFAEISDEVPLTKDKIYVDGNSTSGWFHKEGKSLKFKECCWDMDTCSEVWVKEGFNCWKLKDIVYRKKSNPAYTKDGEKYQIEGVRIVDEYGNIDGKVYYYPIKYLGLFKHITIIFSSKLWIFIFSYLFIILISVLKNLAKKGFNSCLLKTNKLLN